jgi:hypothetical protein
LTFFSTLLLVLAVTVQASAAITVTYVQTLAEVYANGSTSAQLQEYEEPFGTSVNQANDGYSSTATSLIGSEGFQASFAHFRAGTAVGENDGLTGYVYVGFTTDSDASYSVSGSFMNSSSSFTRLASYLYDITNSPPDVPLFVSDQGYADRDNALPVMLTVGGNDGNVPGYQDRIPAYPTSLNGTLLAGHTYYWYARVESQWDPDAERPASFGGVSLQFSEAVPEPATLTIWGLGAIGCALAAYRRKKSAA